MLLKRKRQAPTGSDTSGASPDAGRAPGVGQTRDHGYPGNRGKLQKWSGNLCPRLWR